MSDYISREAAIAYIKENQCKRCSDIGLCGKCAVLSAVKLFESVPAADVRPVVRGKWTKELHPNVRYNQYKCSICGEFSGHDEEGWIWKPNFCPNCGAMMEES